VMRRLIGLCAELVDARVAEAPLGGAAGSAGERGDDDLLGDVTPEDTLGRDAAGAESQQIPDSCDSWCETGPTSPTYAVGDVAAAEDAGVTAVRLESGLAPQDCDQLVGGAFTSSGAHCWTHGGDPGQLACFPNPQPGGGLFVIACAVRAVCQPGEALVLSVGFCCTSRGAAAPMFDPFCVAIEDFTIFVTTDNDTSLADVDFDFVPDLRDNCAGLRNPDQLDSDQDGVGDDCEPLVALGAGGGSGPDASSP
jgi:hypothetical protein